MSAAVFHPPLTWPPKREAASATRPVRGVIKPRSPGAGGAVCVAAVAPAAIAAVIGTDPAPDPAIRNSETPKLDIGTNSSTRLWQCCSLHSNCLRSEEPDSAHAAAGTHCWHQPDALAGSPADNVGTPPGPWLGVSTAAPGDGTTAGGSAVVYDLASGVSAPSEHWSVNQPVCVKMLKPMG